VLNPLLRGWRNYFRTARQVRTFESLDEWIRRRLRMLLLKHWRRPSTIYRSLRALGRGHVLPSAPDEVTRPLFAPSR
jgi:hypothetical protein